MRGRSPGSKSASEFGDDRGHRVADHGRHDDGVAAAKWTTTTVSVKVKPAQVGVAENWR